MTSSPAPDLDELAAIVSNWQRPEDVLETERLQVEAVVLALPALLAELRAARAALARVGELDVGRVKRAIANIAVRHGVVKDPPTPLALMRIYGYSAAPAEMDAEIAAEYARLATPSVPPEPASPEAT